MTEPPQRYDSLGRRIGYVHDRRIITIPGDWVNRGICAEIDPELFFPPSGGDGNPAKRICRECPVRMQCLEWAMLNHEPEGIWGGLSKHERAKLRRKGNAA